MIDYNSDEEENNYRIVRQNVEVLFETNNDLQNDVLCVEHREEQKFESRDERRVEISTPSSSRNMTHNHLTKQIIGRKDKGVMTRNKVNEELCLISQVELKSIDDACKDDHWIQVMKEELDQIEKNETWELVPRPKNKNVIGTKWVFRNKMNEQGEVVRNKAKPICKGYSQQECIDYEET